MDPSPAEATPPSPDAPAPAGSPPKVKTRRPSAETTFRALIAEHIDLTSLADSKAHMMIQVNGLIMSIMLASSHFILESRAWLRLPCAALTATALTSIVFAVLAARPKLLKPKSVSVHDLKAGRASLLFFGNFGRISEDEFADAMSEMFAEDERVYDSLSRHVHGIGSILLGKFRLLRISYTAFLVGLPTSAILFVVGLFLPGES